MFIFVSVLKTWFGLLCLGLVGGNGIYIHVYLGGWVWVAPAMLTVDAGGLGGWRGGGEGEGNEWGEVGGMQGKEGEGVGKQDTW